MWRCVCVVALVLCPASLARAADGACVDLTPYRGQAIEDIPFESVLNDHDRMRVGDIRLHRLPVFNLEDPEQNNWMFRLASGIRDYLALNTREWVLRDELLFAPNDEIEGRRLSETERLLRRKPYLYDARIMPTRRCGDVVDFDVVTRDVWTLNPRIDLTRSGGESNAGIGLSDWNFLGTGKYLSTGYRKNVDRSGVDFTFFDPNVFGSFNNFGVSLAESEDGFYRGAQAGLPFYSLSTRWSWDVSASQFERDDKLYFRGDRTSEFTHRGKGMSAFLGWSPGLDEGVQNRWFIGYGRAEDRFGTTDVSLAPPVLPDDRLVSYPYVGFQSVEDDFRVTRNLNRIQTAEDLYVGRNYSGQFGYSTTGPNRYVFSAAYADGHRLFDNDLLRYALNINGYYRSEDSDFDDFRVDASINYLNRQSTHFSFVASGSYAWVDNLPVDKQLLLGGDSGLRGYPLRYQVGDRRYLASLEQRYFSDLYIAKTVRVGAALFLDVGRAWFHNDPNRDAFGVLADVGIGLRLESTRTRSGILVHIDVARPLVDGPDVKGVQLLISVKEAF